ncbi:Protein DETOXIFICATION [Arachis hypogaea]|nr:Protein DETOXIFICATION [Arachis hypogaea]
MEGEYKNNTGVSIEPNVSKQNKLRSVVKEVRKQICLTGPLIMVNLLNFAIELIYVMFVGHVSELALSGVFMATFFSSVTGIGLVMGMASALDTFCGQSYGPGQYDMLGVHVQKAMLVLIILCLIIPYLFASSVLQCQTRFLQTQNIGVPMMLSSGIATALHAALCWALVLKYDLGSRGAAISNLEAFHDIPSFLKLAIPSAIMVCLELWSFELMVLLSGRLPNPKLQTSVLSICVNTALTIWMIPFGLSGAISTRVSNELGVGNPWSARLAVRVVVVAAIIEGILVATLMIMIRNVWGHVYSNNVQVVRQVGFMLPILAASNFLDGLQGVVSGIVRGCGWQKMGVFINLGSYYVVGVPSAIVLAFALHIE